MLYLSNALVTKTFKLCIFTYLRFQIKVFLMPIHKASYGPDWGYNHHTIMYSVRNIRNIKIFVEIISHCFEQIIMLPTSFFNMFSWTRSIAG